MFPSLSESLQNSRFTVARVATEKYKLEGFHLGTVITLNRVTHQSSVLLVTALKMNNLLYSDPGNSGTQWNTNHQNVSFISDLSEDDGQGPGPLTPSPAVNERSPVARFLPQLGQNVLADVPTDQSCPELSASHLVPVIRSRYES